MLGDFMFTRVKHVYHVYLVACRIFSVIILCLLNDFLRLVNLKKIITETSKQSFIGTPPCLFVYKGKQNFNQPMVYCGIHGQWGLCVADTVMARCPGVFLGIASHFPLDSLGPISYSWNKSSPITASTEWSIWVGQDNLTTSRAKSEEPNYSSPIF